MSCDLCTYHPTGKYLRRWCPECDAKANDYHSPFAAHLTSSACRHFLEDVEDYARLYEHHCSEPEAMTEALAIGRLLHALVELPLELLTKMVSDWDAIKPDDHDAMRKAMEGLAPVLRSWPYLPEHITSCVRMTEAIIRHPYASRLLWHPEAQHEQVYQWKCTESGLLRKYMADSKLPPGAVMDQPIIIDVKSMQADCTLKEFRFASGRYRYREQGEFYRDGGEHEYGIRPAFVFVAVSKSTWRVQCYECSYDVAAQRIARRAVSDGVIELASRREREDFAPRQDIQVF